MTNHNKYTILTDQPRIHIVLKEIPALESGETVKNNYETIVYVVNGSGSVKLNEQRQALAPGDFCHIPAGITHQFTPEGWQDLKLLYAWA